MSIIVMDHSSDERDRILSFYGSQGPEVVSCERLPGAGSDRRYYRLHNADGSSAIATAGDDAEENRAFVALSDVFRSNGCAVPEVYASDPEGRIYIQEDLGDVSLLDLLFSENRMELSRRSLSALADIQTMPMEVWERCVSHRPFSQRLVMWDLNYFKYEFLKPAGIAFDEDRLQDDFEHLADALCKHEKGLDGFMYRDFQSRNVMIRSGRPVLIDFQGGRIGPIVYDAVSFLWQAKACFTSEERHELMSHYASLISRKRGIPVESIYGEVDKMALFRTLQVLGAYGFRGLVERKAHFIESIPGALRNLRELLDKGVLSPYPELEKVAGACVSSRFAGDNQAEGLTVKVFSFSYKKGYPEDLTGNGGGFMFDCRGMHNPGRYDRYKPLTGLDKEVRDFLEEKGEVQEFVRKAVEMVSPVIERYASRGFRSLQVGFGCTGGRHRSVYCADCFAREIARRFNDVRIELRHREQDILEFFDK